MKTSIDPTQLRRPNDLRVASVQMRSIDDLEGNLQKIEQTLAACAAEGVQIAAFPECAVTGYDSAAIRRPSQKELKSAEERLAHACKRNRIHALIGIPHRTRGSIYNAALIIDCKGKLVSRHYKVHLVEQDKSWDCEPGKGQIPVFQIGEALGSAFICHDSRYPELARLPVLAGARVLFYLSHEASLRKEYKMDPYRAQIQARAAENSVYIVHANAPANPDLSASHGQSRIVDPDGNIIKEASQFDEEVLIADLDLSKATADYALPSLDISPYGDWWRQGMKHIRLFD